MAAAELSSAKTPLPVVFGCAGPVLTHTEQAFFREVDPLGFILFHRNIADPAQVQSLTGQLREAVGREAPILIDQEGGRVQRLKPPLWRQAPTAASLGQIGERDPAASVRAAWLNARLIAADLAPLGIDVDCAPVLDLAIEGADAVIGDRAYGGDPELVTALGRAAMEGLLAGGVLPVIKHLPGHGRARLDSHEALPVIEDSAGVLEADLAPFRALADAPFAMTAHIVYPCWDAEAPATLSKRVVELVIRQLIGFEGALISDDIGMGALSGSLAARARNAQMAGVDIVLHCSGNLDQMNEVAAAMNPADERASQRIDRALARRGVKETADFSAYAAELDLLLDGA